MKKSVVIGAVIGLVILAGIIAVAALGAGGSDTDKNTNTQSSTSKKSSMAQLDACTLFTEADAKAILGDAATTGSNTPATKSADISLSNCSYTNNATAVKDIKVITVTVRAPLSQDGLDSNKAAFMGQRPSGAQTVEGYGQDGYWDPSTYQMAILKNDNWISIVYGGTNPTNNTLNDAKLVADKIIVKGN